MTARQRVECNGIPGKLHENWATADASLNQKIMVNEFNIAKPGSIKHIILRDLWIKNTSL